MKKLYFILFASAVYFISSCGGAKTEGTAVPPGMQEVQLKINGNPLSIIVPDAQKGKLEVTEQSWGATEVKVGKDFQISITEGDGDIALTKSDIAGNDVNKFRRYVKDEPTILFWESQITEPEFHFYMVNKIGKVSYVLEDIKGNIYTEPVVQGMVEASKTLKASTNEKPNS